MRLTIKARPEDFIVEEIASLPLAKKGDFSAYLLAKENWNTVELLHELSRRFNIPYRVFSYGGRKDRHSVSRQYITIKRPHCVEAAEEDFSLKFIGFMQPPIGPDLVEGNRFEVTVRKLSGADIKKCVSEIGSVSAIGFPNYFDDQRFGSYDPRLGFVAEKLLKEQFSGALKSYLASVNPQDKKEEKERKYFFFEHWKDWLACLSRAKTLREREVFALLSRRSSGFTEALKKIPRGELSNQISAYQAYLWNEMLRRMVAPVVPGPYKSYRGRAGDYIFYTRINDHLKKLSLPLPGSKAKFEDKHCEGVYNEALGANGLKQGMFNKLKVRQAFFKSIPRKAVVFPEKLTFSTLGDEIYRGKKKFVLKFNMPRGS